MTENIISFSIIYMVQNQLVLQCWAWDPAGVMHSVVNKRKLLGSFAAGCSGSHWNMFDSLKVVSEKVQHCISLPFRSSLWEQQNSSPINWLCQIEWGRTSVSVLEQRGSYQKWWGICMQCSPWCEHWEGWLGLSSESVSYQLSVAQEAVEQLLNVQTLLRGCVFGEAANCSTVSTALTLFQDTILFSFPL